MLLLRLWKQINHRRRFQLTGLFALMIFASIAEILSLAAVLPFLGVLTDPERVFLNPLAGDFIFKYLGLNKPSEILLPITIIFAIAAFASGVIRFLLLWTQTILSQAIGADFSLAMYRRILYQPYTAHVSRNTSEAISGVSIKARDVVGSIILPIMTICSSVILLGAILFVLLKIEPFITLMALFGLAIIYIFIIGATKKKLLESSLQISDGQTKIIKVLQEGLGGIRDVLLDGTQEAQCERYRLVDLPTRKAIVNVQIISVSPRYGVEALGMVLIAFLAYVLTLKGDGVVNAIPVLGVFALGAQRMLPLLQQSFTGWSLIRGGEASLIDSLDLLELPLPVRLNDNQSVTFQSEIEFRNVSFSYTSSESGVLRDLSLVIHKGARIGVVGNTGSGKSTFLDLLLGLLIPTEGKIFVDGVEINDENRTNWQKHFAHVPQNIYLSDSSIYKNITLGSRNQDLNLDSFFIAAKRAQVNEFVDNLEQKYETIVGERGVRLSGGQIQRIGIARALYKNADLLILDEATSALDNETESNVMKEINQMGSAVTLVIVAHRLSTLKNCDTIIEFRDGQINNIGTYEEVIGKH
jgi:ABC-type multidrug transport system fused ATPase/permease subunit